MQHRQNMQPRQNAKAFAKNKNIKSKKRIGLRCHRIRSRRALCFWYCVIKSTCDAPLMDKELCYLMNWLKICIIFAEIWLCFTEVIFYKAVRFIQHLDRFGKKKMFFEIEIHFSCVSFKISRDYVCEIMMWYKLNNCRNKISSTDRKNINNKCTKINQYRSEYDIEVLRVYFLPRNKNVQNVYGYCRAVSRF